MAARLPDKPNGHRMPDANVDVNIKSIPYRLNCCDQVIWQKIEEKTGYTDSSGSKVACFGRVKK